MKSTRLGPIYPYKMRSIRQFNINFKAVKMPHTPPPIPLRSCEICKIYFYIGSLPTPARFCQMCETSYYLSTLLPLTPIESTSLSHQPDRHSLSSSTVPCYTPHEDQTNQASPFLELELELSNKQSNLVVNLV